MAFRELRIKNYRNIGISKEQSLLLNTSVENSKMGSLVFVVGPNNSGKSNCLDALLAMGDETKINEGDLPDFSNQEIVPEISLVVRENRDDKDGLWVGSKAAYNNNKYNRQSFYKKNGVIKSKYNKKVEITADALKFTNKLFASVPYKIVKPIEKTVEAKKFGMKLIEFLYNNYGSTIFNGPEFPPRSYELMRALRRGETKEETEDFFKATFAYIENKLGSNWVRNIDARLNSSGKLPELNLIKENLTSKEVEVDLPILVAARKMLELYQKTSDKKAFNLKTFLSEKDVTKEISSMLKYAESTWGKDFYNTKFNFNFDKIKYEQIKENLTTKEEIVDAPELTDWEKNNNLKAMPNVVLFKETEIVQESLSITPDELDKSEFFKILLKAIDYKKEHLSKQFEDVKKRLKVTGTLRTTEDILNDKLEIINEQFNRLFFLKDVKYKFKILLETNKIEFSLLIGDLPLNLDKQSTGFRWFFNFYFTVIAQKDLGRGDIIIMDEPATNLHVSGITELRDFIKDYAKRTELTFVISTHSPFFIDVDNLDEVRVVSRIGNEAVINDKFQVIDHDDTDALRPIKDALTVGRHILLNPNEKTIFVEGLTDYCYLTTFKINYPDLNQDVHFLPIQGLKKEKILDRIMSIEKLPTILVDNDFYGKAILKQAEGKRYQKQIEVIKLSDIDAGFTTIESLFADSDRPKNKSFETAVTFKNSFDRDKIDQQTVYNFKKLFTNIAS